MPAIGWLSAERRTGPRRLPRRFDFSRVTVVVPNWNSGELLRVCLASVLRFSQIPVQVVVVDSGSDDASRDTAEGAAERGLIELVVRDERSPEIARVHGENLDLGAARARAPYLFALDSDAWARQPGWLSYFLHELERWDASHCGAAKAPPGAMSRLGGWLRGKKPGARSHYIRPCHALYRLDLLRRFQLSFTPHTEPSGRVCTTGQWIDEQLQDLGYRRALLNHAEVNERVGHIRHATVVLNTGYQGVARAQRRGQRRIAQLLHGREAATILENSPIP